MKLNEILKNYSVDEIFDAIGDEKVDKAIDYVCESCDSDEILSKMSDEAIMMYVEQTLSD